MGLLGKRRRCGRFHEIIKKFHIKAGAFENASVFILRVGMCALKFLNAYHVRVEIVHLYHVRVEILHPYHVRDEKQRAGVS